MVFPVALVLYSLLLQDSVAFRVHAPPSVLTGKPVPVVLQLTNRTERPITTSAAGAADRLRHDGPPGPDGAIVWRRLEGAGRSVDPRRAYAGARGEPDVRGGVGRPAAWRGARAAGRYLVAGKLLTDTPEGLTTVPTPLLLLAPDPE